MKTLLAAALLAVTVAAPVQAQTTNRTVPPVRRGAVAAPSAALARPITTDAPATPPVRAAAPATPLPTPTNCSEALAVTKIERGRLELAFDRTRPSGYGMDYDLWQGLKDFALAREDAEARVKTAKFCH